MEFILISILFAVLLFFLFFIFRPEIKQEVTNIVADLERRIRALEQKTK